MFFFRNCVFGFLLFGQAVLVFSEFIFNRLRPKKKEKKKNSTFGKKSGNGPLLFPNKRKLIFSKTANEHLSVVRVAIGEDVMVVAAEITSLGSFRSGDQERGS